MSFVGRETEIAGLIGLLRRSDVRLVTVTGTGGVGKTRLAIRVAEQIRDTFEDGVSFVSLAPVRNPALVPISIGRALGLRASDRNVETALADYLHDRHSLLLLDNFEHLLDASSFIAELLQTGSAAKVLVTSRSVLHVYGEHQFHVLPLPVVPSAGGRTPEALMQSPAVRLFSDRASAADRLFELTAQNAGAVVEICRIMEGLPLGIELAAAQLGVLTPDALLERLDPGLLELMGGKQGQPERFTTMRSAIGWSYDLLDAGDRSLLRRLAVFVGGFTIEAAEAVAGDFEEPSGRREEPLPKRVFSLVERSLLSRTSTGAELRFSMLEVIREFSLGELEAKGELDASKRRHATYYLGLIRDLIPRMSGNETIANLALLETDLPNIRAALSWAFESGQCEAALQMAVALYSFWGYRGHLHEGRAWLLKLLECGETSTRVRIDGLLAVCGSFAYQGDHQRATHVCREAAELAEGDDYRFGQAMALLLQGIIAEWQGNYDQAAAIYAHCSDRVDDFGAAHWQMRILALQAEMDVVLGDVASGEQHAREAMESAKASGYFWTERSVAGVLAYLHLMQSDLATAAGLYHENLVQYQSVGHLRGMSGALAGFAGIALVRGQNTAAARFMGAAHGTLDEIGAAHLKNKGLSDRIERRVRASMAASAYQAAGDAGRALGREWACAEAQALCQMVDGTRHSALPEAAERAGLTRREVDVLYLLTRRLTDREIADALSISPRTSMHHVSNILSKLALESRRQVPEWAGEHGLV